MKINTEKFEPLVPEVVDATDPVLVRTPPPDGLTRFQAKIQEAFPLETLVGYVKDLCEAEDIRMSKRGEEFRTPNWDARKNGLDRALQVLGYRHKDEAPREAAPVQIVISVVNPEPKKPEANPS